MEEKNFSEEDTLQMMRARGPRQRKKISLFRGVVCLVILAVAVWFIVKSILW